jgi:hypothetical protein
MSASSVSEKTDERSRVSAPNAQTILLSQVDRLLRDLGRTSTLLESLPPHFDGDVQQRAVGRLERLLQDERDELDTLRTKVAGGDSLGECWTTLPEISTRATQVFEESLAFLEGALARAKGLDQNLCPIADALLDELSRRTGVAWERFTILAAGELFRELAGIIRLRFPDATVWSLPVVAHEFGHYAGRAITERKGTRTVHPFEELLAREEQRGWRPRHVHELFADVFAAYTLGPAYAFTCLVGRFDPSDAYRERPDGSHPPSARRAHAVLSTLRGIEQEQDETGAFGPYVDELENAWSQLLAAAGQPASLADAGGIDVADFDRLVGELYGLLKARLNRDARYGSERFIAAQQLGATIRDRLGDGAQPARARDDVELADVLNAGWIVRWRSWDLTTEIGRGALDLAEAIRRARARG